MRSLLMSDARKCIERLQGVQILMGRRVSGQSLRFVPLEIPPECDFPHLRWESSEDLDENIKVERFPDRDAGAIKDEPHPKDATR
jgi:hypothetical protein